MISQENIKIKIDSPLSKTKAPKIELTLEKVLKWLDTQNYDEETLKELKKVASFYPHNALPFFKKNIIKHVSKIRKNSIKKGRQ